MIDSALNQTDMLDRELIANRKKHWVRAVTACNSRCVFCLDMDTPRNVFLPYEEVCAELKRGIDELGADKVIISGGEASLHPRYVDLIRYAKSIGYDRVQTVTNGWQYADKPFYDACIEAGLGEITFSLHGHSPALHDRLTQHPGSFKRLIKGLVRAIRDPKGPIVNVDVVINKQNVPYLDKILELAISLGVREFDLLHVIPQSEAFRNRETLFYDPKDHLPMLRKVFRLNRHPGFVIWTNRFPVSFLEGMEDLIQDPHKMLDEVNGRRFQIRRYLDLGEPLDCREPERCRHCFIEPFCTTMERVIQSQNEQQFDVWVDASADSNMPYGIKRRGVSVNKPEDVRSFSNEMPLEVRCKTALPLSSHPHDVVWIATKAEQLSAWMVDLGPNRRLLIELNRQTGPWLLANKERVQKHLNWISIHQPTHEKMKEAVEKDLRNPRLFFESLQLPVSVSGLPVCLTPGAVHVERVNRLSKDLFDQGRLSVRALAKHHVKEGYYAKSSRCQDCALNATCEGMHINMIRDQGLSLLQPISNRDAELIQLKQTRKSIRIERGPSPQPAALNLDGGPPPKTSVVDPLSQVSIKGGQTTDTTKASG